MERCVCAAISSSEWQSGVCRYMDLENFAMEAEAAQAVVLLALHGGIGENGYVQAFLQGYRVPFTGPGWDAASVAIDKVTSRI